MSRVGRSPIPVPGGVTVTLDDAVVTVVGPQGSLTRPGCICDAGGSPQGVPGERRAHAFDSQGIWVEQVNTMGYIFRRILSILKTRRERRRP